MEKATFGAGCFWGVEETFRHLKGVANTLIAGPVVLDDIHVVQQDRDYGAMIKTRGLTDAVVRHLTIAPGGDTGCVYFSRRRLDA